MSLLLSDCDVLSTDSTESEPDDVSEDTVSETDGLIDGVVDGLIDGVSGLTVADSSDMKSC